jgi:outer membrane cobalamin receptor
VMHILGKVCFLLCYALINVSVSYAIESAAEETSEDTMLMFVGEDLEVLSIASRREESARQAPAVARSVNNRTIRDRGAGTLSDVLKQAAGFHMAQREWGTQPYLRGIPDSVLFLYDTMPMGSDITKSLHSLDKEMSMAAVKRVEIIRGPGSVLWGPDAFAGIVNVVPMTGKDLEGVETGVSYEEPRRKRSFYVNMGHAASRWDAFLSVSGQKEKDDGQVCNVINFWGTGDKPVPPERRYGSQQPGSSRFYEVSGRFSFENWLTVSGKFADNHRAYAASNTDGNFTWKESRKSPHAMLKLEARKTLNHASAFRFTGAWSLLRPEIQVIDKTWTHEESTAYGEIIYDRSVMAGRGLFTGGTSVRQKRIRNAPIWTDYLPAYLGPTNLDFLAFVTEKDYDTTLKSYFGRYKHKFGLAEIWFGARHDDHNEYQDDTSINTGLAFFPTSEWTIKGIYGTAYRTPFTRQLLEEARPDLEKITSFNFEVAWKPSEKTEFSICNYFSRIKNHFIEHPYTEEMSQPNKQDLYGIEFEGRYAIHPTLELAANLTWLQSDGPDEKYIYNYYTFLRPDGSVVKYYKELEYPYDSGPEKLFNLIGTWRPDHRSTTVLSLLYEGSRQLSYPQDTFDDFVHKRRPGGLILNLITTLHDYPIPGMELEFSAKNLLDRDYEIPGMYNTISGDPLAFKVMLRKKW